MSFRPARISQLFFLALFLILFVMTEYRGRDEINAAVNVFFRLDPLVLASYLLAAKAWSWLLFPALLIGVATLALGRFFCGWLCPLGTILDLVTPRIPKSAPIRILKGGLKNWLLAVLLMAALFNLNLAGLLDPIAILLRGLTFLLYPLLGLASRTAWIEVYQLIGAQRDVLAPAYDLLRNHLLPFRETLYPTAFLSALLLLLVVALERFETRNWCRNLCPLGTLLGWLARFTPFKRIPPGLCGDCGKCRDVCPTNFGSGLLHKDECSLCMECQRSCPGRRISFVPSLATTMSAPVMPQRRLLLGGAAAGALLAVPSRFRPPGSMERLLRPPGMRDEEEFLKKCVRCGECMKVCLRSALYPYGFAAGLAGVYTPHLVPRLGYCEYNCTLCGQVCPTGAIPALPVEAKQREVIGKAVLDRNHCLPFAKKIDCMVCEEHCPIPEKAIRSRAVSTVGLDGAGKVVMEPYVVEQICNGCGICENVCPLEGKAGIEIFAVKNHTPIAGWTEPANGQTGYGNQ